MAVNIEQSPLSIYNMTGAQAIPQDTDWTVTMTYMVGGLTIDLSTYTGTLQVKQTYDGPVLLNLSTSNGGLVLSSGAASTPNVTIKFLASLTLLMPIYTGMVYDIKLVSAAGLITRFVVGQFELQRAVAL